MTLPTSDAQPSKSLSDHPHSTPITPLTSTRAFSPASLPSSSSLPNAGLSGEIADDDATDFTASSWDLATGALKALTAKREVPFRVDRRPSGQMPTVAGPPRNYTFALIILACIIVMLISGGVVLLLLAQP